MRALLLRLLCAALALLALTAAQTTATGFGDLSELEAELVLLEQAADAAPSAAAAPVNPAQVLGAAKEYASNAVTSAVKQSNTLLQQAQQKGETQAKQKIAELKAAEEKKKAEQLAREQAQRAADEKKAMLAQKQVQVELVRAAALLREKEAELAKAQKASAAAPAAAQQGGSGAFRSRGMKPDRRGVIGGVGFGVPKSESAPVLLQSAAPATATHMNQFDPHGKSTDIYGRKKACLKDIAAHFDEKDVYEAKKAALQQQLESAKSRTMVESLRKKLTNLETWHQMMQKKFLMSAQQEAAHEKRMERLFDAHLPAELKQQLEANKVAKRAAQKEPFPDAMAKAKKVLRMKRTQIAKDERMRGVGLKKMIRPQINDPEFPSMDPISSHLREKLWRRVHTADEWSTEASDVEVGENLVRDAHKLHGDFVGGPIAEPILRGKLYNPDTERLGVPNFLTNFPWPKVDEPVTMNDKVEVEQTYHQTW